MPRGEIIAAYRLCSTGSGPQLAVVGPSARGLELLFEQGWEVWCGWVSEWLAAETDGAVLAPSMIVAEPERIERADDRRAIERLCETDPRSPRFLAAAANDHSLREFCHVREDLLWFEAHFPGHPVVPGVVLLDWAIERIKLWRGGVTIRAISRLKFQRPVLPGTVLRLEVSTPAAACARWLFDSRLGVHARAELQWAAA